MLQQNPQTVKIVYKNFPLPNHPFAQKASIAALAAGKQGKFWEYHDKVFAEMRNLSDQKFIEIAQQLGLDMTKFNKDLADQSIMAQVMADMQNGQQAGVRGTPTLFVNGRLVKNRSLPGFQSLINEELLKAKKK